MELDRHIANQRAVIWQLEDRIAVLERDNAALTQQITDLTVETAKQPRPRRHDDQTRFGVAQRKALLRDKDWALTRDEFDHLTSQPCTYCGDPTGGGVGLDRLDNSRGYESDNVVPCCGPCNLLRGNRLTPEQTRIAVEAIRSHGQ